MGTALAYAMCNVQVPVLCLLILLGILLGEHVMHLISQVTFAPGLANQHETDHSNKIVDGSKHTCMLLLSFIVLRVHYIGYYTVEMRDLDSQHMQQNPNTPTTSQRGEKVGME
jgi:hypothetical protein